MGEEEEEEEEEGGDPSVPYPSPSSFHSPRQLACVYLPRPPGSIKGIT